MIGFNSRRKFSYLLLPRSGLFTIAGFLSFTLLNKAIMGSEGWYPDNKVSSYRDKGLKLFRIKKQLPLALKLVISFCTVIAGMPNFLKILLLFVFNQPINP